jgi:hypothetical protein
VRGGGIHHNPADEVRPIPIEGAAPQSAITLAVVIPTNGSDHF